jgi:hypothetical protein
MKNPYQNHGNELYYVKMIRNTQQYLNENIQHSGINMTLGMIIETAKHMAFEEGRKQGRFELSRDLKNLLTIENPNPIDADDTSGY